ncbi:hypothetical protein HU765_25095 [Pseudomonas sp. SWRI81]|uniref:hypothetical protein n=1 Tax=Pseudomonas sp. SWRI81 TaxID=2745505 RepID=UPI00164747C5|nr:hypothetical protein [Pseudomonas sp. SWRI81]MBC3273220.1 hypothetical protein [Pseudomonas sp. SWRI81]
MAFNRPAWRRAAASQCLALLLALSATEAQAVNQEIRALFQPDPSQPNKNLFVNQTPNSGYCAYFPGRCEAINMFSIELPVRHDSTRAIEPGDDVSLKAPTDWKRLTVTHQDTGETETVEVRITGIGSRFVLSDTVFNLTGVAAPTGHDILWTSRSGWLYAPPPCGGSGLASYSQTAYRFFWHTPVDALCTKTAAFRIPSMYFEKLDIAYELRTPDPLGMSSGLYTGSIGYTIGPSGDFQLGSMMEPDDGALTLDFVLDVLHTLKVEIPPGGNKVVLEPEGGWQGWLEHGRRPTRLYRDQVFNISASSKFTMKIECEHDLGFGNGCGIIDRETGYVGAVNVSVSLPNGLTDSSGQPVRRMPLRLTPSSPFQPGIYVDRKPGTLHFEVDQRDVNWLIDNARDKPYKGNITVIWDSEVG